MNYNPSRQIYQIGRCDRLGGELIKLDRRYLLFGVMTLILAVCSVALVVISYQQSKRDMLTEFEADSQGYYRFYNEVFQLTVDSMTLIASLISEDELIQRSFQLGADALASEGGGEGGKQAEIYRADILKRILPAWEKLTRQFDVRQLHFHLPPRDTSFLRVHQPESFGDDLSSLRHMVVDVISDQQPRSGFEFGRVYSGIRSVVPVFARSDEEIRFIGALEAGTSFVSVVDTIKHFTSLDVAVLTNSRRVEDVMWDVPAQQIDEACNCFLEASTLTDSVELNMISKFAFQNQGNSLDTPLTSLVNIGGETFVVTSFSIQDYVGMRDGAETPVGTVVLWTSAQPTLDRLDSQTKTIASFTFIGFITFTFALAYGIFFTFRQLQQEIDRRTSELLTMNITLEKLAYLDHLTGVLNRRALMEQLDTLFRLARRSEQPLSVLMLDIDFFKAVNDKYGHQAGDEVLINFAKVVSRARRSTDVVGRYGGEEFIIALPYTSLSEAEKIAESIRKAVEQSVSVPGDFNAFITCSIGISEISNTETIEGVISRADEALYKAKTMGRNRVQSSF